MGRTGLDHKRSFSYAHVSIFIRQGYTEGKRENGPAQTRRQSRETVREGGEVRWLESRKRVRFLLCTCVLQDLYSVVTRSLSAHLPNGWRLPETINSTELLSIHTDLWQSLIRKWCPGVVKGDKGATMKFTGSSILQWWSCDVILFLRPSLRRITP